MRGKIFGSLRSRLISLAIVVEIVLISAIVWNSHRLTEEHLVRQFELRRAEISLLLQAAVATAMVQRDYASVSETLASAQRLQGMVRIVMYDEDGQRITSAGSGQEANGVLREFRVPVIVEQQAYGELAVSLDLSFLEEARREILLQNIALAIVVVPYYSGVVSMDDRIPELRARGIANDNEMFRRKVMDELWVYGDHISKGVRAEIELAISLGIPVSYKSIKIRNVNDAERWVLDMDRH